MSLLFGFTKHVDMTHIYSNDQHVLVFCFVRKEFFWLNVKADIIPQQMMELICCFRHSATPTPSQFQCCAFRCSTQYPIPIYQYAQYPVPNTQLSVCPVPSTRLTVYPVQLSQFQCSGAGNFRVFQSSFALTRVDSTHSGRPHHIG